MSQTTVKENYTTVTEKMSHITVRENYTTVTEKMSHTTERTIQRLQRR